MPAYGQTRISREVGLPTGLRPAIASTEQLPLLFGTMSKFIDSITFLGSQERQGGDQTIRLSYAREQIERS